MNKTKVKMILMSYLSDLDYIQDFEAKNEITNFCKFLIQKYPDTNVEIDFDIEFKLCKDLLKGIKEGIYTQVNK